MRAPIVVGRFRSDTRTSVGSSSPFRPRSSSAPPAECCTERSACTLKNFSDCVNKSPIVPNSRMNLRRHLCHLCALSCAHSVPRLPLASVDGSIATAASPTTTSPAAASRPSACPPLGGRVVFEVFAEQLL